MIDDAERGSVFFRLVISPDPATEDTEKDLRLNEITAQAMTYLEEHLQKAVPYVAAEHDDHAPHRHVHIIAMVKGRLNTQDFQALRQTATEAALLQRQERDQAREQQQEGAQWAV
jgi:galactose-1-phosphate uridylyltransferase